MAEIKQTLMDEYGWYIISPAQKILIDDVISICAELAQLYFDKKEACDSDIQYLGIGDFIKQRCR